MQLVTDQIQMLPISRITTVLSAVKAQSPGCYSIFQFDFEDIHAATSLRSVNAWHEMRCERCHSWLLSMIGSGSWMLLQQSLLPNVLVGYLLQTNVWPFEENIIRPEYECIRGGRTTSVIWIKCVVILRCELRNVDPGSKFVVGRHKNWSMEQASAAWLHSSWALQITAAGNGVSVRPR